MSAGMGDSVYDEVEIEDMEFDKVQHLQRVRAGLAGVQRARARARVSRGERVCALARDRRCRFQEASMFYYPCPCGDKFQISIDELLDGEGARRGNVPRPRGWRGLRAHAKRGCGVSPIADIAHCPSCSLLLRVIYDEEALTKLSEAG